MLAAFPAIASNKHNLTFVVPVLGQLVPDIQSCPIEKLFLFDYVVLSYNLFIFWEACVLFASLRHLDVSGLLEDWQTRLLPLHRGRCPEICMPLLSTNALRLDT